MNQSNFKKCWYESVCLECDGSPCSSLNSCIRYLEMSYLMKESGLPQSKQRPIILDAYKEDYDAYVVLDDIRMVIGSFVQEGNNILISSSNTGNGKTSWAIKLLLKYFDEVWAGNGFRVRGLFVHVPTLLMSLKNFENPLSETYKQNLLNADLVVWDDIAVMGASAYDYSNLLMYIDHRILNEKSNIFTSNIVEAEDFVQNIGMKLTSRILNSSKQIVFTGKDRRNGSITNNQQSIRNR